MGVTGNTGEVNINNWENPVREGQGSPDWVVVIDDASAGYDAPGR